MKRSVDHRYNKECRRRKISLMHTYTPNEYTCRKSLSHFVEKKSPANRVRLSTPNDTGRRPYYKPTNTLRNVRAFNPPRFKISGSSAFLRNSQKLTAIRPNSWRFTSSQSAYVTRIRWHRSPKFCNLFYESLSSHKTRSYISTLCSTVAYQKYSVDKDTRTNIKRVQLKQIL